MPRPMTDCPACGRFVHVSLYSYDTGTGRLQDHLPIPNHNDSELPDDIASCPSSGKQVTLSEDERYDLLAESRAEARHYAETFGEPEDSPCLPPPPWAGEFPND